MKAASRPRQIGVAHLVRPVTAVYLITMLGAAPGQAQGSAARPVRAAEETRLNIHTFREALKKRGLTEFLELHLHDFPPSGTLDTLFALRDVKLVEMRDMRRPRAERRAAAAEANRILEDIIRLGPDDIRRFDWYFTLAHSLVYDEGESHFTNILYRGGTQVDRDALLPLTTRALAALDTLKQQLTAEFERIDALSVSSYEALERSGYVEQLDQLPARADYLLLWTLLYDSLARDAADATRATRLNRILTVLGENQMLLTAPHEQSKVQLQSMLLAGMTHRRLNDYAAAREQFNRAFTLIQRLEDGERSQVSWAVTLTHIESVRNDRDDARFEDARAGADKLQTAISGLTGETFGLQIVTALLERSIGRAQADHAEQRGQPTDAARLRHEAWKPLARLVQQNPDRRDEVYAALYSMIPNDADFAGLDPFEQCARIAGLLHQASGDPVNAAGLLTRLVEDARKFLAQRELAGAALTCEVVYNLAVAEYRRDHPADAARRFLQVVVECPQFHHALPAALYAVQLAADLHARATPADTAWTQALYSKTLKGLLTAFPDSEAARHWRFWYARLLQERGEYGAAAMEFSQVEATHEHAAEARFERLMCLARELEEPVPDTAEGVLASRDRVAAFFGAHREFLAGGHQNPAAENGAAPKALGAHHSRARLLGAEVTLLPVVDKPAMTLEVLKGFEDEFPEERALLSRVWRSRLVAYQRLGQLEEAARAIPAYVAADPNGAGPTLQSIYLSMTDEIARLRDQSGEQAAHGKAEAALILAREINAWSQAHDPDGALLDPALLRVQWAEAHLNAGDFSRARDLFTPLLPGSDARFTTGADADARALYGHAEALFQLGAHAAALPDFNRLAIGLPAADPLRWKALLRDLQCRTALQQAPGDVLKVIAQQRHLHPNLGGPTMAAQFEKLERENQRR